MVLKKVFLFLFICLFSLANILYLPSGLSTVFAANSEELSTTEPVRLDENTKPLFKTPKSISIVNSRKAFDPGNIDFKNKIGTMSYKYQIAIDGKFYFLYPTLDNPGQSLSNLQKECSEILNEIRLENSFDPLSINNINLYEGAVKKKFGGMPLEKKESLLVTFFDVYDNEKMNDDIIKRINSKTTDFEGLYLLLPTYVDISEYYNPTKESSNTKSGFSLSNAIAYASQYAVNPNLNYVAHWSDCTNFVSQIQYAGGAQMSYSSSEWSGWWCKPLMKTSSVSWKQAAQYHRYFGAKVKTGSFKTVSEYLKAGDVIAFDRENDGKIDHMGYVTAVNRSKQIVVGGKLCYNFKIAQHSRHYHAWVSGGASGWANITQHTQYYIL